jgi:sodium transport system ATP-binding protein
VIEVIEARKHFGDVVAVKSVSFCAERGQIFGLLGPNGAGKTTTLRMLYGLLKPSSGTLRVDGINMAEHALLAQQKMGVLPDGGSLYTRLSARENIRYYAELQGLNPRAIKQQTERFVELLGMQSIIDRRTQGFSQGERMKVCLARALVHDPDYVLLDEPSNGLDVLSTRAVRELLLALKSEGKCIIFSSHLMHEVERLCDQVAIITQGIVSAQGSIEQLMKAADTQDLEEAFVHFAYPRSPRSQGKEHMIHV